MTAEPGAPAVTPIFLLSLPRSGSTLVQRMLAAHPEIATAAEPWVLLSPLYATRVDGVYAEYSQKTSAVALRAFVDGLPGGRATYHRAVAEMASRLYGSAAPAGTRYFLDKTPRYSLIAEDLFALFPDAKVVFLWRNPLAVVASIVDEWFGGRWMPYRHKVDLYGGLDNLVTAFRTHAATSLSLRYEDLVTDPAQAAKTLLDYLELPYVDAVVRDPAAARVDGPVGDRGGVRRYTDISSQSIDRWKGTLTSPVRARWCRRYLDWIGSERLATMGYDLHTLRAELDAVPASPARVLPDAWSAAKGTVSLVAEPRILRHKMDRLRARRGLLIHT